MYLTSLRGGRVETFIINAAFCGGRLDSIRCGGAGAVFIAVELWCQNISGVCSDRPGIILAYLPHPVIASDNISAVDYPPCISILLTHDWKGIARHNIAP